ncbi:MAG TPA: hypothetical protein VN950_22835 [Terriglobales bacterium]|jgi:hypothetical protein|nr:hypothetical protein [Terriglobales bacterium]
MSGPPDKWSKTQMSTTSDPNAQTSNWVLNWLNNNFPINGAFAAVCSDGTFLFGGYYS